MVRIMRTFVLSAASAALLLASACLSDSGSATTGRDAATETPTADASTPDTSAPDTSSPQPDAGLAKIKLTPPPPLQLKQGATLDVTIDFERNGVTGPITLTASGQGNGTSITIAPIGDGSLTTQMKITTVANAQVGSFPVTLKAPNVAELTFQLIVAGPSGSLDTSFDSDGILLETTEPTAAFNGVATQADGKIIVVGTTNTGANKWLVRRYNPDGTPDAAFNQAVTSLPGNGAANTVAIDPKNGRIVVAGDNGGQTTIMRFLPSGAPDQSFDGDGSVATNPVMNRFGSINAARGIAILADSSIVVTGSVGGDGYVIHFLEAGTLDPNFTNFFLADLSSPLTGSLSGVFALQNGLFVAGNRTGGGPPAPIAVRLQMNGKVDLNFGTSGVTTYLADCSVTGAGIATNDDVMMVGKNPNSGLCAVRATPSGSGSVYGVGGGNSGQMGGATAGPNESFYANGWYGGSQDRKGFVQRRLKNGSLDTTFGDGGEVVFEDTTQGLPDAFTIAFRAITTMREGRIVAVGQRTGNSNPGPIIYRIWP